MCHFLFWAHLFPTASSCLLFDHFLDSLYKPVSDYSLQRVSYTVPQKDFWFLILEQLMKGDVWLSSTKKVPASVVFWTLPPQLPSSIRLGFKVSAAGTKVFNWRLTKVPNSMITIKTKTWSDRWEEGRQKRLSQERSARSWSQIKRQN
jgi:hypothetical protein